MFEKCTKTGFVLLLALGSTVLCSGQQQPTASDIHFIAQELASGGTMLRSFDNRYKGVKGSVVWFEAYVRGKIFLSNGKIVIHDKLNYDAYNDQLLLKRNDEEFEVSMNRIKGFMLITAEEDSIFFTKLLGPDTKLLGPDTKIGFFQKLNDEDQVGLYKRIYKTLDEPSYRGAYNMGKDYSEFVQAEKLLLLEKGKRLKEFKNRKSFLELFPEKEEVLKQFIKQEKIDFQNEADLQKLFRYLNEMMAVN